MQGIFTLLRRMRVDIGGERGYGKGGDETRTVRVISSEHFSPSLPRPTPICRACVSQSVHQAIHLYSTAGSAAAVVAGQETRAGIGRREWSGFGNAMLCYAILDGMYVTALVCVGVYSSFVGRWVTINIVIHNFLDQSLTSKLCFLCSLCR